LFCLHLFPLTNVEATKNEAKFISKIPCVPDGLGERKKYIMSMSRNLAIEVKNVPMLLDHISFVGYKTAMLRGLAFCGWDRVVLGHIKCPNEKGLAPSTAEVWQEISLSIGRVSAEMLPNLELEFSLLKLQEGEDTRGFFDKMKDHQEKMFNLGSELADKKMVNQIFNSVPISFFRGARYLHYNLACLTAAHVMIDANAVYDGLKLRGEIKSPAAALAAISSSIKKSCCRK
jgi:hypothetical protein